MPLALPEWTTDAGIVARMLIAESKNPGSPGYDADEVKRGLHAMKATVENRLRSNPAQFNAPGAKTLADIITAPGQWHGFSRGPAGAIVIAPLIQKNIDDVLRHANTGAPGRYHAFVSSVLQISLAPARDPFESLSKVGSVRVTGGTYGWRTAGRGSPGGRFVAIPAAEGGVIAGNQFFVLAATT